MKTAYNYLLKSIDNFIVFLHKYKMYFAEHIALYKKKSLYKDVKWSKVQKKEFDSYWKKNFGKKITPNGHKLYESINGIFHKNYFPDFLFSTKLELKLNNLIYANIYSDKSLTELLYSKSDLIRMPKTYLIKINGIWYDKDRCVIGNEEVKETLFNLGKAVIKPTLGGNSGKGIIFCDFENGIDKNEETSIEKLMDSKNKDFIIQELMQQHESFSKLYPKSINTIRAITYIAEDKIHHSLLSLRLGSGNNKVDNIHAGGVVVGVKENGELLKHGYILGYSNSNIKITHHPDTQVQFEGYLLHEIKSIIEISKKLHGLTPHIGMISWDFMVSKENKPVLIEANYMGQSVWFPQIIHGKPIFGEHTEYMLKLIK